MPVSTTNGGERAQARHEGANCRWWWDFSGVTHTILLIYTDHVNSFYGKWTIVTKKQFSQ